MNRKIIQFLSWDTEHFGFKVGKFYADPQLFDRNALMDIMKVEGYKLVYLFSNEKLPIEDFYDYKLIYTKKRSVCNAVYVNEEIVSYRGKSYGKDLEEIAIASGFFSRYHQDPEFPDEKFEDLYKLWLANSVNGELATDVLVQIDHKKRPKGLITYKVEKESASIGIIAVSAETRNSGIGSSLIHFYENNLPEDVTELKVVTQEINKPACCFYERIGYKVFERSFVYHIWI